MSAKRFLRHSKNPLRIQRVDHTCEIIWQEQEENRTAEIASALGMERIMKNYKIYIQYDGTRYKGWQVQKKTEATIQGKIEAILSKLAGNPIEVIGSGRTDAGVHAREQTANFHIEEKWDKEEILSYLNHYLPEDIAILKIEEVDERFHSRYHALEKTYVYRIQNSDIPNVFERKYMYQYPEKLNLEKMRQAASYLTGTHDFTSFCANKKMKKSAVRTIYEIQIEQRGAEIRLSFRGNGFLQNMVRILTGTLIEVGSGRIEPEEIKRILDAKDREQAGYTAPASGLILWKVQY